MLRTIREGIKTRQSNRPPETARPLKAPKDPDEHFLLAARQFVTDKPVGFKDIEAKFESFPGLKDDLRTLIRTGVIQVSEADPEKFEFTPEGYEWAKDTLASLTISAADWARAEKRFAKPFGPQGSEDPQVIAPQTIQPPSGSNVLRFPGQDR